MEYLLQLIPAETMPLYGLRTEDLLGISAVTVHYDGYVAGDLSHLHLLLDMGFIR